MSIACYVHKHVHCISSFRTHVAKRTIPLRNGEGHVRQPSVARRIYEMFREAASNKSAFTMNYVCPSPQFIIVRVRAQTLAFCCDFIDICIIDTILINDNTFSIKNYVCLRAAVPIHRHYATMCLLKAIVSVNQLSNRTT